MPINVRIIYDHINEYFKALSIEYHRFYIEKHLTRSW